VRDNAGGEQKVATSSDEELTYTSCVRKKNDFVGNIFATTGSNECDSVCQSYSSIIFPQKSPVISGSLAERDLQLQEECMK